MRELINLIDDPYSLTEDQVITTDITTLPQAKVFEDEVIKPLAKTPGQTAIADNKKVELFKINASYIGGVENELSTLNLDLANLVFNATKVNPIIDGKAVDLQELPELMKKSKNRNAVMKQIVELRNTPGLSNEVLGTIHENDKKAILLTGRIQDLETRFNKELKQAAQRADGEIDDAVQSFHQYVFKEDGSRRSKKEYEDLVEKLKKDDIDNLWKNFGGPHLSTYDDYKKRTTKWVNAISPEVTAWTNTGKAPFGAQGAGVQTKILDNERATDSINYNKVVNAMPIAERNIVKLGESMMFNMFVDPTAKKKALADRDAVLAKYNLLKASPFRTYSKDDYIKHDTYLINQYKKIEQKYKKYSFDNVTKNIESKYNLENSSGTKLEAVDMNAGLFGENKGGDRQAITSTIPFDMSKAIEVIDNGDGKKVKRVKPNVEELLQLITLVNDPQAKDIKYSVGDISANSSTSGIVHSDEDADLIKEIISKIADDAKSVQKAGSSKNPRGEITFSGIAGSNKNYHAFHVKFDSNYLQGERFGGGTKGEYTGIKKNSDIVTKGFTIYVPADISVNKTIHGQNYKKGTSLSSIMALLNSKKEFSFSQDGAGSVQLLRDDVNRRVIINKKFAIINPKNGRTDSLAVDPYYVPYSKASELDAMYEMIMDNLWNLKLQNDTTKSGLSRIMGVNDPNKLRNNQ